MSSSEADEGPPCKRDKKTLDLDDEEDRSDSIPHPVVPLSIRDIRLDLNLIPDTVILETMKLVSNQDRRELSYTCRRFRNMIMKNKTPEMDRRKTIDSSFDIEFCHDSSLVTFDPCHSRTKFGNFAAFEDFVKRIGSFFVYKEAYICDFHPTVHGTVDVLQMIKLVCGVTHSICGVFLHTTIEEFRKLIDVFFECPQLDEIDVYPDDAEYPEGAFDEFCTIVTKKGKKNGIEVRRGNIHGRWICKKLSEGNGREIMVISGTPDHSD